mmetsp:Transcript_10648/g.30331  ORF Transcript_10648/g.30331 Transcript_10648/m.30331 type:complete len:278 (+) Transcript_10648:211-1044(+)
MDLRRVLDADASLYRVHPGRRVPAIRDRILHSALELRTRDRDLGQAPPRARPATLLRRGPQAAAEQPEDLHDVGVHDAGARYRPHVAEPPGAHRRSDQPCVDPLHPHRRLRQLHPRDDAEPVVGVPERAVHEDGHDLPLQPGHEDRNRRGGVCRLRGRDSGGHAAESGARPQHVVGEAFQSGCRHLEVPVRFCVVQDGCSYRPHRRRRHRHEASAVPALRRHDQLRRQNDAEGRPGADAVWRRDLRGPPEQPQGEGEGAAGCGAQGQGHRAGLHVRA